MSIEVGSKVKAKAGNAYWFEKGLVGEVVEVFPPDHFSDGTRLYGVSFAEAGEPDPGTGLSKGWNMLDHEIEEV